MRAFQGDNNGMRRANASGERALEELLTACRLTHLTCKMFFSPYHHFVARTRFSPPIHNREPYDTLLSDTIATDPSVEPMPLSSTRSMRMSVCGVRAPSHGQRTVPCDFFPQVGAPTGRVLHEVAPPLHRRRSASACSNDFVDLGLRSQSRGSTLGHLHGGHRSSV